MRSQIGTGPRTESKRRKYSMSLSKSRAFTQGSGLGAPVRILSRRPGRWLKIGATTIPTPRPRESFYGSMRTCQIPSPPRPQDLAFPSHPRITDPAPQSSLGSPLSVALSSAVVWTSAPKRNRLPSRRQKSVPRRLSSSVTFQLEATRGLKTIDAIARPAHRNHPGVPGQSTDRRAPLISEGAPRFPEQHSAPTKSSPP